MQSAKTLGCAELRGYELRFDIPGMIFEHAVGNIAAGDDSVWGVLYEVNRRELETRMDFYEGVRVGEYQREKVTVLFEGKKLEAQTYRNPSPSGGSGEPSELYLRRMLEGARQAKLPPAYVKTLQSSVLNGCNEQS